MIRTRSVVVVTAAVVLALAGCGQATESGGGSPAAATASAPADPAALMAAAATTLDKGSYRYAIESPIGKMTGVVHAPSDSQQMTATGKDEDGNNFKVELVEIGSDRWMKLAIDAGDDPVMKELAKELGAWRHASREEAAANFSVAEERLSVASANLLKNATGLEETGSGTFAGTLDVTASPFIDLVGKAEEIKALGDKAKSIPVVITLDGEGRATSVVFDVPAGAKTAAYRATITFSDYDKVEAPKAPPADQVKQS